MKPEDDEAKTTADLSALQVLLMALINTHPDRRALLAEFDKVVNFIQLRAVQDPKVPPMVDHLRESLNRLRGQISQGLESSPPTPG